jgi:hemolysin activation/secretion protein
MKILNSAQFYEHAVIGGPDNLRGYNRERFWGKTSYYNNNELRFITNLHTYIMNAKFGVLAFFDDARVWLPGETSNTIHTSFGGGILLAPFNAVSATITYGISKEQNLVQLRINKLL